MRKALALILSLLAAPVCAGPIDSYPVVTPTGPEKVIGTQSGITVNMTAASIAALDGAVVGADPRAYGAKCDGITDDAAALNSAFSASISVLIPQGLTCAYGSNLAIPAHHVVTAFGNQGGLGVTSLKALAANLSITVGSYTILKHISINCSNGTSSSGNCLDYTGSVQTLASDVLLSNPFNGIMLTGSLNVFNDIYIYFPTATTGTCLTVNSAGSDQKIDTLFCQGVQLSQPRSCIDLKKTGSIYLTRVSCLWTGIGKLYEPAAGDTVSWIWDTDGTYDSGTGPGIEYAPATGSPGGTIKGDYNLDTWTSSGADSGVAFVAAAGAVMDDIHYTGHRAYANALDGMLVGDGVTNLFVDGGAFCGNSASSSGTYNGITFGNDTHVSIVGVRSGACAALTGTQGYGVLGSSASANYLDIENNDLVGNATGPASLTIPTLGTDGNWVIRNNNGIDDTVPTISSATSTAFPLNPTISISGTTTITTITGMWQGRQVTVIPTGALPFNTGGNIASACTATANTPVGVAAAATGNYVRC